MKYPFAVVPPYFKPATDVEVTDADCLDPHKPITMTKKDKMSHWHQEGTLQFVTLRLADSLPTDKLEELYEVSIGKIKGTWNENISEEQKLEIIEYWLSQNHGECLLKYEPIQKIVIEAIEFYNNKKYVLLDYVVMPNHIHLIALPFEEIDKTMGDFSRYTANKINKLIGKEGKFWMNEPFDWMIRSVTDYMEKAEYIRHNPDKIYTE